MTDIALKTATELVDLFRRKQASPVEAAEAALARAHRFQEPLNAFVLIDDDSAVAAARESEARWQKGEPAGPVDGVPVTIKDLVYTRGWPTRRGSKAIPADQPWEDDAPATAHLRNSGAVILGKTTTPEMGWKGVTDSPLTGITRNPWNTDKTPGGSSGGAAAACAVGAGALHIGTDGGGSIRIPSGFTGIFGHKATFGRVPAWPLSPFGTIANVGPMTRCVSDAALMLNVIARPDWRDWYGIGHDENDYLDGLEDGVSGLRIAFSPTLGGNPVEPGVAAAVAAAAQKFADLGATVDEAEPALDRDHVTEVFITHWFTVANTVVNTFDMDAKAEMDPGLLHIALVGSEYSTQDLVRAETARREIGFAINRFFQDYDLLLTPSLPLPAFDVGRVAPPADEAGRTWINWTPFTYPFNLSRNPACSVPCGLVEGLPVGLQIVGRHYEDNLVLRAARAYEAACPWDLPPMATA
jgi:aspartyl-tRNA(Asn)/glutamyl-tRNA(Gln) amidotransferase subunit A